MTLGWKVLALHFVGSSVTPPVSRTFFAPPVGCVALLPLHVIPCPFVPLSWLPSNCSSGSSTLEEAHCGEVTTTITSSCSG